MATDHDHPDPIALRAPEAARALGIGLRKLWEMTNSDEIPHARLGRAILYPTDQLRAWLAAQAGPRDGASR